MEKVDPVSKTIKGEVMTVKQMIERHLAGQPIRGVNGQYVGQDDFEGQDLEKINFLDPVDLDMLRAEIEERIQSSVKPIEKPSPTLPEEVQKTDE